MATNGEGGVWVPTWALIQSSETDQMSEGEQVCVDPISKEESGSDRDS